MLPPRVAPTSTTPERLHLLPALAGWVLAIAVPVIVSVAVWGFDNPDFRLGTAFLASVAIVAALAGTAPAILSTVVGAIGFWYTIIPPPNSFEMPWPDGPVAMATYLVCAGVVVFIVHDRDRASTRMAEFRRRDQRLSDQGLIGTFSWQLDGPITGANDAFLEMLGFTRDDLLEGRLDWTERTPPEYLAADAEKVQELLDVGFHEAYEKEYVRKDGTRVPVLLGSSFLEGSTRDGVSFVLDISERWRLEAERERLLEAEQMARRDAEAARRLLEVVADGVGPPHGRPRPRGGRAPAGRRGGARAGGRGERVRPRGRPPAPGRHGRRPPPGAGRHPEPSLPGHRPLRRRLGGVLPHGSNPRGCPTPTPRSPCRRATTTSTCAPCGR